MPFFHALRSNIRCSGVARQVVTVVITVSAAAYSLFMFFVARRWLTRLANWAPRRGDAETAGGLPVHRMDPDEVGDGGGQQHPPRARAGTRRP